jgi:hypothetical protein
MKFQTIIRTTAILIGMGAALVVATPVKAQEIENAVWSDGPNAAPFEQQATAASYVVEPAATATPAVATQNASVLQQTPSVGWLIPIGLVALAMVLVPVLAKARRRNVDLKTAS